MAPQESRKNSEELSSMTDSILHHDARRLLLTYLWSDKERKRERERERWREETKVIIITNVSSFF